MSAQSVARDLQAQERVHEAIIAMGVPARGVTVERSVLSPKAWAIQVTDDRGSVRLDPVSRHTLHDIAALLEFLGRVV